VDGRNKSGHDSTVLQAVPSPAWRGRKFNYSAARRGGGRIDSTPSTAVAEIVVRTM
jgi:hypothetical protein